MKVEYTPETDTLYIEFKKGRNVEGENLNARTVAYYTPENELVALEIEHAKKSVNLRVLEVNGRPVSARTLLPKVRKKPTPTSPART